MQDIVDKATWSRVTLDDVVIRREDNDKERAKNRFDRFVKVEHMDAESLHIRRWGQIGDEELPPTFYKIFRKGQILFPTRNPHLRRTALASFDGICGEKTLTLEPNKDAIAPELLPFLFHSENFVAHTTSSIIGSTNPHVRWRDVAKYEFLLPPKDQQARLAELLWAGDGVQVSLSKLISKLNQQLKSFCKKALTLSIAAGPTETLRVKSPFQTTWVDAQYPKGWKSYKLNDVISDCQNGFAEGKRDEAGIPQLRMNNVTRSGRIDLSSVEMIPNDRNIDRFKIEENDVLLCNTNSEDLVGKSILASSLLTGFTFSNHFTRLRPKKDLVTPKFLHTWLKFQFDIGLFERRCTRWIGQAAIQTENLMGLYIVLPPLEQQTIADTKIRQIEQAIEFAEIKLSLAQQLQKSLINQIL